MYTLGYGAGHYVGTGRGIPTSLHTPRVSEWDLNKKVVEVLESYLSAYDGIRLVRVDDPTGERWIELSDRCKTANEAKCDLFLSIHHNGGINGGSGGGVTAYSYPGGSAGAAWRDKFYDQLIADYPALRGNRASPKTTANFQVLRETNMPAVLLELGFMDSTTDVPLLLSEAHATLCAEAIGKVLVKEWGLTLKEASAAPAVPAPAPSGEKRYDTLGDVESGLYRATLEKLIAKGYLNGRGGEGEDLVIDLTEDAVRLLVVLDRAGFFGE